MINYQKLFDSKLVSSTSFLDAETAKQKLKKYENEIDKMTSIATDLIIENDETHKTAISYGTQAKRLYKEIEKRRDEIIDEPKKFINSVRNFVKTYLVKLENIEISMKDKIKTYNLRYKDKNGDLKPVRFSSYIWKRIDGFILDYLKEELAREKRQVSLDW